MRWFDEFYAKHDIKLLKFILICEIFFLQILHPLILFIVRLALTIFCVVCVICSGFQDSNGETKWFIYLTNWSFTILTISFILLSSLSACDVYREWKDRFQQTENSQDQYGTFEDEEAGTMNLASETETPGGVKKPAVIKPAPSRWYHQIFWLVYDVAFCVGIFVTICYWSFVLKGTPDFLDISTHALNTVFILVEVILGRVPIRLLHVVYTMIYLSAYVIFTVIYWTAGGRNAKDEPYIYEILDYEGKSAGSLVVSVLSLLFIGVPVCQIVLFGLYKLRCHWFDPFNIG